MGRAGWLGGVGFLRSFGSLTQIYDIGTGQWVSRLIDPVVKLRPIEMVGPAFLGKKRMYITHIPLDSRGGIAVSTVVEGRVCERFR